MQDMLRKILQELGSDAANNLGTKTIGILEQGPQWSVYSMKHEGYTSYLQRHFRKSVPFTRENIDELLDIMHAIIQIQRFLRATRKRLKHTNFEATSDIMISDQWVSPIPRKTSGMF